MRRLRPRLTYANVVSSLALFVALGGTSYAVARNSVGTLQLRKDAVTSVKIRDGAIQTRDLAPSARVGSRGPRGPSGPAGAPGAPGEFIGTPEDWRPLPMQNGWDLYDTAHQRPAFRKDRQGLVHLRGLLTLTSGTPPAGADTVMATLPTGYRPSVRTIFVVAAGQGIAFARLIVDPDGTLKRNAPADVAEKDYTSLNGVTFWPE